MFQNAQKGRKAVGLNSQMSIQKNNIEERIVLPLRQVRMLGKISASTTISASSTECLLICESAEKT